jgi:hypothetical protein
LAQSCQYLFLMYLNPINQLFQNFEVNIGELVDA